MDSYAESSGVETSPEMNSSFEMPRIQVHSPEPKVKPRKLMFNLSANESDEEFNKSATEVDMMSPMKDSSKLSPNVAALKAKHSVCSSPPYRSIRKLRLFDSPATPKTILHKSTTTNHPLANNNANRSNSKMLKFLSTNNNIVMNDSFNAIGTPESSCDMRTIQINPHHSHQQLQKLNIPKIMRANFNPFTPQSLMMRTKKRVRVEEDLNSSAPEYTFGASRSFIRNSAAPAKAHQTQEMIPLSLFDGDEEYRQAPKRIALQETNISRYEKEFVELELIGSGEFGLVFQCLNRLDGCVYAIKKSIKPVAGSAFEKAALNEVWAHAVLGKHDNVVRYYSAWAEDNHMIIQNEYCNGGSLATLLQERHLVESELRTLLIHIAEGLKYIHSNDLVHMDIKSGNIFLSKVARKPMDGDDGFEDSCDDLESDYITTYKIGDLGHVTSVNDPHVEEGDCRYLAKEVLHEDYTNLQKSDIFSLGITLYEAAGGGPLPKNGPEWHKLRCDDFPILPHLSKDFNNLLKLMMHPNPEMRPSSTTIFNHPVLCPLDTKSKAQLSKELNMERQKNDFLTKKLKEASRILKSYELSRTPVQVKSKAKRELITVSDRKLRSHTKRKQQKRRTIVDGRRNLRDNHEP